MKKIHRYIFRSVLFACLASVALFVFVLLAGNALKDIIGLLADGRLRFGLFLQLMLLLIPYVFAYALPLGMLTGILLVLGRMSAERELVAMKSSGMSLWHISTSIILIAIMGVGVSCVINNYYSPSAKSQYRNILSSVVRNDPMRFIVSKSFIHDFPGYVLFTGDKDGNKLRDIWVWELDDSQRVIKLIRAENGTLRFEDQTDSLLLTLNNAVAELRSIRNPDNLQAINPVIKVGNAPLRLPLNRLFGESAGKIKLSSLNYFQLNNLLRNKQGELAAVEKQYGSESANYWNSLLYIGRIRMEIQNNLAMAFSILALALIGIPLGIKVSRKESYANLGLALALALGYYFLIIAVNWLENRPDLRPDLIVWTPNLFFCVLGIYLIHRANRH